jgi:hypothetical protein
VIILPIVLGLLCISCVVVIVVVVIRRRRQSTEHRQEPLTNIDAGGAAVVNNNTNAKNVSQMQYAKFSPFPSQEDVQEAEKKKTTQYANFSVRPTEDEPPAQYDVVSLPTEKS